jgi:hypothetical protein
MALLFGLFPVILQYVDPGSMGIITQLLYIVIIGIGAWFLIFFRGTKHLFYRLLGKKIEEPVEKKDDPADKDKKS